MREGGVVTPDAPLTTAAGMKTCAAVLLGLASACSLLACKNARTPEGAGYEVKIDFQAKGSAAPPVQAEQVKIFETTKDAPPGLYFGRGLTVAEGFPSPEQPHRYLGSFRLHETIDFNLDVFKEPAFVARRHALLKEAAAKHGANAVFFVGDQQPDPGVYNLTYLAVSLSSAPPVYPEVDAVLGALHLAVDGFKEVHRFVSPVTELGARKPEPLSFKAGHEYMLAVAFHPGAVELGLADRHSLGFLVKVDRDVVLEKERQGNFTGRIDKPYEKTAAIPGVDGVFARGGAGTMGGDGRSVKIEFASRKASVRFTVLDGKGGPEPRWEPGAGKADFVVYERAVPKDQLVAEVCDFCRNAALSCNKRKPLEACEALQACFKQIEQPATLCGARYKDL